MPRIAKSLGTLRAQVDAAHPGRAKFNDGWIGDAAHQARKSDHNPNAAGVVQAVDLSHDPEHGFDSYTFADMLRQKRDPRIKYVISNRRIFSSGVNAWEWRPYDGADDHSHHVHISASDSHEFYDDDREWDIDTTGIVPSVPATTTRGKSMRYRDKWPEYAQQCDTMVIKPERVAEFTSLAEFAIAHKATYQQVADATGVQWYHVAVIHRRESDAKFTTYLGNGQPLNQVTTEVPAGRGPFASFLAGAVDALHLDGLDKVVPPWPLEKILYFCEVFNGGGYSRMGLPSPYIFGGTNIQHPGKYVRDNDFDPNVWDTQPGCAPTLWMIAHLDTTVHFTRET